MQERPQHKPNEFCVTVACDGLHPDDIEELRRSLDASHYAFKVEVAQKIRTEDYPELFVVGIRTTLFVRFFAKWFYGQTRHGGIKAVVKAIDDVLENSTHDRDQKPKVSLDSNGQELVTMELHLRPRTTKHSWSRDKLALVSLILTGVAAVAAIFVVPEFRRLVHLDKPEVTQQAVHEKHSSTPNVTEPSNDPIQSVEPSNPLAESKEIKSKSTQRTDARVTGNKKFAGNNIPGDDGKGNSHQAGSLALAPNGIAISGGTVNNPTVNNFGKPSSSRHLTESQKTRLIAFLKVIAPKSFYFLSAPDAESTHFGNEVLNTLTSPELGWKVLELPSNWGQADHQGVGLFIVVSDLQKPAPGAVELQQAFKAIGIEANGMTYPMVEADRFAVYIGVNPASD